MLRTVPPPLILHFKMKTDQKKTTTKTGLWHYQSNKKGPFCLVWRDLFSFLFAFLILNRGLVFQNIFFNWRMNQKLKNDSALTFITV